MQLTYNLISGTLERDMRLHVDTDGSVLVHRVPPTRSHWSHSRLSRAYVWNPEYGGGL